jgi:exonuclease SbcD
MRILHTSDWHLGRSFGAFSLLDDQRRVLERIVGLVREQSVDLVVVAGDLFDRAVPSTEAVVTLREALTELRGAGAQVVLVAGNHDSAERMAAYDGLLEPGLLVVGGYRRAGEVTTMSFADGPLEVVALPYLDPLLAPDDPAPGRHTHASVLAQRLAAARRGLSGCRSLAVAHAFVAGGTPSESERELAVGGAEQIGVRAFDGFDYVALGHLHSPQSLGRPTLAYSGSPLAYSFSETAVKSVQLVELDLGGVAPATVERIELGVCRGVVTLSGSLRELLTAPEHEVVRGRWVRAQLTDAGALVEPMARLRQRFPFTVEMHRTAVSLAVRGSLGGVGPADATSRTPIATVSAFWQATVGEVPSPEVLTCIRQALVAAGATEAPAPRPAIEVGLAPAAVAPAPTAPAAVVPAGDGTPGDDGTDTLFDDTAYVAPSAAGGRRRLRAVS